MRAEWFIWPNLDGLLHVRVIACIFHVSNELLNTGEEGGTICSCLLSEMFREYHEFVGLLLRAAA